MLRPRFLFLCSLAFLLVSVGNAPSSYTQTEVSGRYQCAEAKVNGKRVPCPSGPLHLKENGRYEIFGREGEYRITGEWLVLSEKEKQSRRAKIAPGHRIIFQYRCGARTCEVTFERRRTNLGSSSLG